MMLTWTPGPWYCSPSSITPFDDGEPSGYIIQGSNDVGGGPVLPILGRTYNWPNNFKANAHLIAAAPELYEALKAILDLNIYQIPAEHHNAGVRALRKASALSGTSEVQS